MFYRYKNTFLHDKCHKNFIHYLKCCAWGLLPCILIFGSFVATYIDRNVKHQVMGSFFNQMREEHVPGLCFGLTVLIIEIMIVIWSLSDLVEQILPECGGVNYTHQEIDIQVNSPVAEFYPSLGMYSTPELVVGFRKGVKSVCYDEVLNFRVVSGTVNVKNEKNKWERKPATTILVRVRGGRIIYLAVSLEPHEKVREEINKLQEKCLKYNPNVKKIEFAQGV